MKPAGDQKKIPKTPTKHTHTKKQQQKNRIGKKDVKQKKERQNIRFALKRTKEKKFSGFCPICFAM